MTGITPPRERCQFLREHMPHGELLCALPGAASAQIDTSPWPWPEGIDPLNGYLFQEIHGYLTNTLLRDADALTMASSLELRPIFLDHALVEFCFALPTEAKLSGGRGKAILRHALRGVLPASTLLRRKQGFGLPKEAWMNGPLAGRYRGLLNGEAGRKLLSPTWRKRELMRLAMGRAPWTSWTVATLLAWIELHHIDVNL
jgi:asparagine synthetase B (glutamine-hydrolysing)